MHVYRFTAGVLDKDLDDDGAAVADMLARLIREIVPEQSSIRIYLLTCCQLWLPACELFFSSGKIISAAATHSVQQDVDGLFLPMLLDASTAVIDRLIALRDAGVQVARDDFGTGYSSLSYLKKFDIDYIKIDRSFVRNLAVDSDDLALCEAIIVMAHKLGLKVISEGIETEQQHLLLTEAGCDFGQGFLYSRTVPAEAFEGLLQAGPLSGCGQAGMSASGSEHARLVDELLDDIMAAQPE